MWNSAWNKFQFKVCQVAHGSLACLDKHSTLDSVMVSVVSSIPNGGNCLRIFFFNFDRNSGLKCKCDLIMKNSTESPKIAILASQALLCENKKNPNKMLLHWALNSLPQPFRSNTLLFEPKWQVLLGRAKISFLWSCSIEVVQEQKRI